MNTKKYVMASFGLLFVILIDYFFSWIKYHLNPAEFLISSDFSLVATVLALILAIVGIRKGNKWGWLALGLSFLPLVLGALIYIAMRNWN